MSMRRARRRRRFTRRRRWARTGLLMRRTPPSTPGCATLPKTRLRTPRPTSQWRRRRRRPRRARRRQRRWWQGRSRRRRGQQLLRRLSVRRTPPPRPRGVAGRRRCARQRITSSRESMRRARASRTSTLRGCSSSSAELSTPSRRRFGVWSRCSSGASPPLAASAAQSCTSTIAMRSSRRRTRSNPRHARRSVGTWTRCVASPSRRCCCAAAGGRSLPQGRIRTSQLACRWTHSSDGALRGRTSTRPLGRVAAPRSGSTGRTTCTRRG
mmetsp:Transcript_12712/g.40557  ORF Transcript_12712/g.40557 Transcript_12712/m.40557 type:complete len:268 (+) Transcript_12712:2-805(+)